MGARALSNWDQWRSVPASAALESVSPVQPSGSAAFFLVINSRVVMAGGAHHRKTVSFSLHMFCSHAKHSREAFPGGFYLNSKKLLHKAEPVLWDLIMTACSRLQKTEGREKFRNCICYIHTVSTICSLWTWWMLQF